MTRPSDLVDIEAEMEAARISFERWRNMRRRIRPAPSQYDGCRTEEDDRLDDPRHGQAESINRGW